MILHALVNYYERLAKQDNVLPAYGWSWEKISYCIVLNDDGSIYQIEDIRLSQQVKNKTIRQPNPLIVPVYPEGRTSGVKANYIWDNTAYVLGVSEKPNKLDEKYQDFWKNVQAFDATNSKALQVLQKFPAFWNEHKQEYEAEWNKKDFLDSNIVFRVNSLGNQYVHACNEFKKQWNSILEQYLSELSDGQCLIEGTTTKIADLHNPIKGVDNAQSSGALLVSFNKDAFESYGLKKGKNSSVGTDAAFKYVTALNHLLRRGENNKQRLKIGDAITVFWAESANKQTAVEAEEDFLGNLINPDTEETASPTDGQETQSLATVLQQVAQGIPLKELRPDLNPATKFYVLGISPNAARLAIRFWYATTLDEMARHIGQHYQDLHLEPQFGSALPEIWKLTYATAPIYNDNGKQKTDADKISPQLAGNLARAIFTGQLYPQSLLSQVLLRMRLDGVVSFTRVALCKAVINREIRLNKKTTQEIPMSLDIEEKNPAYRMGRLFAVIEEMQKKALGEEIKATIRDRYWGAASATPALVFPMLERNMMNHLSKIRKTDSYPYGKDKTITGQKLASSLDWQVGQIKEGMETSYPKNLNLQDQGRFAIGYYHQRFTRKIKTKTGEEIENPVAEDTDISAQPTD
ncbi:type I-C CRISPR-associated protein Cas8c/Csd1 [Crenothrix sp.]|uniref:type I-C CRISPR-associated protein Cas8c/Csd1 n=1 Tax=Crenothrix sp. TaxID=3100433 RepID=UPI00374D3C34